MTFNPDTATRLIRVAVNNPEAEFEKFLQQRLSEKNNSSHDKDETLLAVDFDFCEYWRDEKNSIALTALFFVRIDAPSVSIAVLRAEQFNHCVEKWQQHSVALIDLLNELPAPVFSLDGAIPLQPISIPKPWGQEIWYTGIEKRGVAEVGRVGCSVPLPWLLAVAPQRLTGGAQQPILLKILDPLPEPVFGDLYFELHRQKQEIYIVTAIDQCAWPDGVGAIRFGFNAKLRDEYVDDATFVRAYLTAVQNYRTVRKQIDGQIDAYRARDGIGLNDPVSASVLAAWMNEVAPNLKSSEEALRARMESFTALKPLSVGDVVKVPCLLPHSLQHGVRTVEFQTPVYERLILSFAQKVLTQSDWDTDEAAVVLKLDPEPPAPFPSIAAGDGWIEEQIVQFDDFEVRRITLQPRASMPLQPVGRYRLGMVVGQPLLLGQNRFNPDDAILLPASFDRAVLANDSDAVGYFLLASPLA